MPPYYPLYWALFAPIPSSVAVLNEARLGGPMPSKKIEQGWLKAEKQIQQNNPQEALDILRETDADAANSKTYRLAGEAKALQARQAGNNKKLFKEAVGHYESSLKSNPNDKKARRGLNSLRSEMDGLGIRAGGMAVLFDDGAPTFLGIVSIVVALGLILVALKLVPEQLAPQSDDIAVMTVSWGGQSVNITIELHRDDAPIHVDNFVKLAERGEYTNVIFHRIINDFMIQGGDFERQDGMGGYAAEFYGYCDGQSSASPCSSETQFTIPDEADNGLLHDSCVISMAKTGDPNTGGSQFFLIPEDSNPTHLDGLHTVFGTITSGCGYVTQISEVPVDGDDKPISTVILESVIIT
jgi:cyclophilin family peptidyl-prolyl cis-trans isomerase